MAALARIETVDHEARLRAGAFADSPYGSLMGRGPRTFKKKPVLVIDADELQQAHLAIATGGAQIMEDAGEPQTIARPRPSAMLLGLAPIGAGDDWQPPVFVPKADDHYAFADAPADGWEALPEPEPELEPELEPESHDDFADRDAFAEVPAAEPLAAPQAIADDDDWVRPLPLINEQLARMRQLTQAPAQVPAGATESELPPETQPAPMPEPDPWFDPAPVAAPEPEQVFEPVVSAPAEPAFDLPHDAILPEPPVMPEPTPAPAFADDHYHDGPDLSWMQPKERRRLVFSESAQSQLRARLVSYAPEPEPAAPPSLWSRLRGWFARLLG